MPRRTKEAALQTRHALLDAAESVFDARGVSNASLQEIAETAGVTRGAVYWHFRDKPALFNAMMERAILPFEERWLVASPDDAHDPLRTLQDLLLDILNQTADDARLQRAVSISRQKVEYVDELNGIRERRLLVREQALKRIERLLCFAIASGQITTSASPTDLARALHATVDGLISNWMLDRAAFDLHHVGRIAVEQMLAGLLIQESLVSK